MEYRNELLKVKIEDYVAVVMIDRPPLNILTLELSAEMQETFHRLEEDPQVRVIVLRGSGEKAFCVGADIKEFPQVWDDVIGKKLRNENLAIDGIELLDKPVIAVPTSVGYGASFHGLSALLTMINSCANGIATVNIDNGYGAGYLATQINRLAGRGR